MKFKMPNERKLHERKHDGKKMVTFDNFCNPMALLRSLSIPLTLANIDWVLLLFSALSYPCSFKECQLVATTWTQLQKHLKTHPIEYSCAKCEKKFKGASALRRHKQIHAVQGSERVCPMEDCKLNFRTAFNLEHHIRKDHFKILEYKCNFPDCQKAFAMKINCECRQKRPQGRRNPVIEEKLTGLFNEKLFKSKSKIESDLSGLFNERKIPHPVTAEANLVRLFENQLSLPAK
ncbi:hypothetical protein scyTo_0000078 [Scyliorhinus torazame]|uniref:C2H2-type domain-containing protein n=1 Tax=Scyliorhinus torazame TaxID=75743 RepID=A0A401NPV7_SCYTO|nr:hypothetical protein [Scyliorhinus torazame]